MLVFGAVASPKVAVRGGTAAANILSLVQGVYSSLQRGSDAARGASPPSEQTYLLPQTFFRASGKITFGTHAQHTNVRVEGLECTFARGGGRRWQNQVADDPTHPLSTHAPHNHSTRPADTFNLPRTRDATLHTRRSARYAALTLHHTAHHSTHVHVLSFQLRVCFG